MPKLEIDLTKADDVIADGDYVVTIKSVEPKTSKDGQSTNFNWLLALTTGRTLFHNTNSKIPSRIKAMMDAAKSAYDETGFDPQIAVGAQINVRIGTKETPEYGIQNVVNKVWAV